MKQDNQLRDRIIGMPRNEKIAYIIRDSMTIADATKEIERVFASEIKEVLSRIEDTTVTADHEMSDSVIVHQLIFALRAERERLG